ncbi:MAG: glycoside hydrolase family 3 C-terminal domain-containing protein [Actinobacteria bacterium]|nr:glycoside hydrolase family 3 C-terminal domain-containing protein [Actinomycetota bacterium]
MAPVWLDASVGLDERVAALVADLGADDLAAVALGDFAPLTGRGLPAPDYVDSGTGLRGVEGATAFPAGVALAATFDAALAEQYGAAVGAEARAAGFPVVLGPTLDLARDPRAGRIPEALGEDPYLSGLLGAAHVRGLQGNHVIAQLKHFVAYNGESRRTGYGLGPDRGDSINVLASEALLQDAYLRPFRAAIEAGAWSMMGSYNRLNGAYTCESADLLDLPRSQWGWRGFYCPDFLFAVRDDARALAVGLDLGALGGPGGRTPEMVADAPSGVVRTLVENLARALIGSGLVDDPLAPVEGGDGPSTPDHRQLAEDCAAASMVLLRNEDAALPFGDDVRSIAVIGPSGTDALFTTGGSAAVALRPDRVVTPLDGLRERAGQRRVEGSQGSLGDVPLPPVPAAAFVLPDGSGPGVEVVVTAPDGSTRRETRPTIDQAIDPAQGWPGRWRARLTSTVTGPHRLSLAFGGRASVHLDGEEVMVGARELERFLDGPAVPMQVVVDLVAGEPALLQIDLEPGPAIVIPPMGLGPSLRLGWQLPDDRHERAAAVAQDCDAAVVVVTMACSEGMDRDTLALPGDQDALVRRVAAANPRTVVVLNTPGAVLMPWLDDVAAVLQVWYPGERFGAALAGILFGDTEPGGRLPLTFPRSRADLPDGDQGPAADPTDVDYDADDGIGYRAAAVREKGALFAFGHGLGYAGSAVPVVGATVAAGALRLDLEVTNPSGRATTHVAQLYAGVGDEAPELVGVVRVPVAAGATVHAEATVGAGAFARWDAAAGDRLPVAGTHALWVAASSAGLGNPLRVRVEDGRVVAAS